MTTTDIPPCPLEGCNCHLRSAAVRNDYAMLTVNGERFMLLDYGDAECLLRLGLLIEDRDPDEEAALRRLDGWVSSIEHARIAPTGECHNVDCGYVDPNVVHVDH